MPRTKREKTAYPGVFVNIDCKGGRTFSIRYRKENSRKQIEEVVGKSSQGMTAAKANRIRSQRIAGKEEANPPTFKTAHSQRAESNWTLLALWEAYLAANPSENTNRACEISVFNYYLRKPFGNKTVTEISTADIDAFRNRLLKRKLAPATVYKPMELIRRLLNFGARLGYIVLPRTLHFNFPRVDNQKTEVLTDEQLVSNCKNNLNFIYSFKIRRSICLALPAKLSVPMKIRQCLTPCSVTENCP